MRTHLQCRIAAYILRAHFVSQRKFEPHLDIHSEQMETHPMLMLRHCLVGSQVAAQVDLFAGCSMK